MKVKIRKKIVLITCLVLVILLTAWTVSLALDPKNQEYDGISMKQQNSIATNIFTSQITTKFGDALNRTTYADMLNGNGPYTVFVPTDEAYRNLPEDTSEALFGITDPTVLLQVVPYHIVQGTYKFADLKDGMTLQSIQGEELRFKREADSLLINGYSSVRTHDVLVKNGVIHVVDNFLIPPSIVK